MSQLEIAQAHEQACQATFHTVLATMPKHAGKDTWQDFMSQLKLAGDNLTAARVSLHKITQELAERDMFGTFVSDIQDMGFVECYKSIGSKNFSLFIERDVYQPYFEGSDVPNSWPYLYHVRLTQNGRTIEEDRGVTYLQLRQRLFEFNGEFIPVCGTEFSE